MRTKYVLYIKMDNGIEVETNVLDNSLVESYEVDIQTVPIEIKKRVALLKILEVGSFSSIGFHLYDTIVLYLSYEEFKKLAAHQKRE